MLESNSLLFIFCFLAFFFLFVLFFYVFFLLYFCPMLFTPEMRSSKYSSKWCGFLSCCLCPSVSVCMPFSACWLLFPSAFGSFFFPSLLFGSLIFLSFLGVTELRLSELSVCYRTVHMSIAMADSTNYLIAWFSVYRTQKYYICSKVDITPDPICLFPFTTTTFCAGRASQNWIYGYGTLLFILLCLKGLPRSSHSHTLLCHLLSKTNNWVSLNLSLFSPAH